MDRRRQDRELVFCHQCEHEWFKDQNGLVCPVCDSEFTEVVRLPTVRHLSLEILRSSGRHPSILTFSECRLSKTTTPVFPTTIHLILSVRIIHGHMTLQIPMLATSPSHNGAQIARLHTGPLIPTPPMRIHMGCRSIWVDHR